MELCLNMEGDKKFQYINYCMHRINMLRHHNINPVLVFDGGNIPCKALTEQDRHSKRKGSLDFAMAKLKEGNINAATEMFQRAVSITPSMAHQLIQTLKLENIEFVVAPYEADAQLAYLSSLDEYEGGIAAVISEDSDLLAYGCSSVRTSIKLGGYRFWNNCLPPRVNYFVWRLLQNRLPTKPNLSSRGIIMLSEDLLIIFSTLAPKLCKFGRGSCPSAIYSFLPRLLFHFIDKGSSKQRSSFLEATVGGFYGELGMIGG